MAEQDGGGHGGRLLAGRYRLVAPVAVGDPRRWRATDETTGTDVVARRLDLAVLTPDEADAARVRIMLQTRAAAAVHHPAAVAVLGSVLDAADLWQLTVAVDGRSLSSILAEHGPFGPVDRARHGVRLADVLAAAHAVGVVHRAVHPGNVLVGEDGRIRLGGFAAGDPEVRVAFTRAGTAVDGLNHLAPEVARGETPTPAADVLALGATLYSAVEGSAPFGDVEDNPLRVLQRIATGRMRAPVRSGVLEEVLARLLALDPAARPDAAGARELLREVVDQGTGTTVIPRSVPASGRSSAAGRNPSVPRRPHRAGFRTPVGGRARQGSPTSRQPVRCGRRRPRAIPHGLRTQGLRGADRGWSRSVSPGCSCWGRSRAGQATSPGAGKPPKQLRNPS